MQKRIIWIGAMVGGWLGGYVPLLWGASYFSFSSLFFNALGALVGIYTMFKFTQT